MADGPEPTAYAAGYFDGEWTEVTREDDGDPWELKSSRRLVPLQTPEDAKKLETTEEDEG